MANGIFFTKEFWPTVGGIGEHSHQMARHLTELGENITLLHHVPEGLEGDDEFDRLRVSVVTRDNVDEEAVSEINSKVRTVMGENC